MIFLSLSAHRQKDNSYSPTWNIIICIPSIYENVRAYLVIDSRLIRILVINWLEDTIGINDKFIMGPKRIIEYKWFFIIQIKLMQMSSGPYHFYAAFAAQLLLSFVEGANPHSHFHWHYYSLLELLIMGLLITICAYYILFRIFQSKFQFQILS